jgi:serine/threonine-protein kinase HipA
LLRRIGAPATAGVAADWKLLLAGAGNPIGNLRVKEAADWLAANAGPLPCTSTHEPESHSPI